MSLPSVSVTYSNGNLLKDITTIDGICGLVATADQPANIGVAKQVFSLADAEDKGITLADEPFLHGIIKQFYTELGGKIALWVMGTAETDTMAQVLDHTDPESAVKLIVAAGGTIRLLGVCRKADSGYDPGPAFLDSDVEAALTASQTFCQAQLALLRPLRVLIEGIISDEDSLDILQPKDMSIDYAGVVLGNDTAGVHAGVGIALGRAAKYGAHIKLGKVANGALSISNAFIGTKNIKSLVSLEALHDKGFISFMVHPQKAGIYFGRDLMANSADYRYLTHGRLVDKAAVIAALTYVEQIEDDVFVNATNGNIDEIEIKHLENVIKHQINVGMGEQISGLDVSIASNQDILNTSTLAVQLRIIPKGYLTYITIDLGLKAPTGA